MVSVLQKDFEFYLGKQNEFVHKYPGRFLLIRDAKLVDNFETEIEAIRAGLKQFEPGTFLVQRCEPGTESYTQTFHSRVFGE